MKPKLAYLVLPIVIALVALVACGASSDPKAAAGTPGPVFLEPDARAAAVPKKPNVVVIVMDEFPGDSLLDRSRRIDAIRYPNFAGFARNATWFPNAFSRYDSTPKAVPLIMDGKKPYKGQLPDRRGHPRSIWDLFHKYGYTLHHSEEATAICPPSLCRGAPRRRPSILKNLRHGRQERLEKFFASVKPGKRPGFWLKHVLLPHGPYMFLQSGAAARRGAKDLVPGMNSPPGFADRFITEHNEQRYIEQLEFTDRELGKLFRRLVRLGMYDNTMVVLVADHGFAWEVGVKDRRKVNGHNVDEIAPVPLFIKPAGQRAGKINRSYASTLDVTPTIADILNFKLPYHADGRSAFSSGVKRRRVVSLPNRGFTKTIRISARRYEARRRGNVRKRLSLFGAGSESIFNRIGASHALVGQAVSALSVGKKSSKRGRILRASALRGVRRSSGLVPNEIVGNVSGRRRSGVVVAVNGRIEAAGSTWHLTGQRSIHFALNVPETSLREGRNSVQVYEVGKGRVLHLLASD